MAEHTPGPWECDRSRGSVGHWHVVTKGEYHHIASVNCRTYPTEIAAANARLIAAAPKTKARYDAALQIINQAIPFVVAWANNHPGPEGNASHIGTRLTERMQKALEETKET